MKKIDVIDEGLAMEVARASGIGYGQKSVKNVFVGKSENIL